MLWGCQSYALRLSLVANERLKGHKWQGQRPQMTHQKTRNGDSRGWKRKDNTPKHRFHFSRMNEKVDINLSWFFKIIKRLLKKSEAVQLQKSNIKKRFRSLKITNQQLLIAYFSAIENGNPWALTYSSETKRKRLSKVENLFLFSLQIVC